MTKPETDPPWKRCTFTTYLSKTEFPSYIADIAVNCLAQRKPLDITVMAKMETAFKEYMDNDFSYASIARMITAQGYETRNDANTLILTYLNGRPTRIALTACAIPSAEKRIRTIALGPWNIARRDGIDFYPFFAAGLVKAIDPFFNKTEDI